MPAAPRRRTDDLLDELLRGSEPAEVRCEAALALATLGRSAARVIELLAPMRSDPDEQVRRAAVLALGRTRDGSAAEPVVEVLESSPELWEESAAALAELRCTRVIPRLREVARSARDSRTQRGAIRALAALGTSADRVRVDELLPPAPDDAKVYPLL